MQVNIENKSNITTNNSSCIQTQAFEFIKMKMIDDSYTDLDRAELKQTVLDCLLVNIAKIF